MPEFCKSNDFKVIQERLTNDAKMGSRTIFNLTFQEHVDFKINDVLEIVFRVCPLLKTLSITSHYDTKEIVEIPKDIILEKLIIVSHDASTFNIRIRGIIRSLEISGNVSLVI